MAYTLVKQIKDNEVLRRSFIELAIKTFNLSFEEWYNNGFWTDKYIPYVYVENDRIIANASANIIDTVWQGQAKRYIQIGTVMTDENYRNMGFSRKLVQEIIDDWKDKCDCIYLFANGTVLDFYPKFGFVTADEYQYEMPVFSIEHKISFLKLNMDKQESRDILKNCYENSNPFSALPMEDNYGLLMFYCGTFMKDCVYYSEEFDMVCVAQQEGERLICFDIFGKQTLTMEQIVSSIAGEGTKDVVFGFTPKEQEIGKFLKIDRAKNDTTLFVLKEKENIFSTHQAMFPELSHA